MRRPRLLILSGVILFASGIIASKAHAQNLLKAPTDADSWLATTSSGAKVDLTMEGGTLRADVKASPQKEGWHARVIQTGLPLVPGKRYYMKFDARTQGYYYRIDLNAYPLLRPFQRMVVNHEWHTFLVSFVVQSNNPRSGNLGFFLGENSDTLWFRNLSLTEAPPSPSSPPHLTLPVRDDQLATRAAPIFPTGQENGYRQVPWRTDFREALEEAKRTSKPLYLWVMDGVHPCGDT